MPNKKTYKMQTFGDHKKFGNDINLTKLFKKPNMTTLRILGYKNIRRKKIFD